MLLRTYQYVFLPILFPFFFLLYTDPTSQLFVLFGLWAAVSRHAKTAALFAILSVCIRQTNIIWLFFLLLYVLIDQGYLDEFFLSIRRHASRITVTLTGSLAKKSWKEWFWTFWVFGLGLILFAVFVKMNGGVAIGDKGAHPFPAFHLGNVYFLLFCFFCLFLPINIANLNRISEMIAKRKLLWLGIIIAFFIFYMLTFVNDHYNNQAGLSFFLRNKILVFYTKTEWHKAVFFLPILYATLSLCVMRFERLQHGMAALSEAPIYIDDKPGSTVLAMRSVARRLKMEKGLGLVVIDYLQLITPGSARANDSTVQQVTEISRALKGMARELDVPVLALSQLSRAVESRGGRPRLSDLRDSGSLEQDADVVMFIHREDMSGTRTDTQERTNIAEVLIEKHRNGPLGRVELKFDDQKTTFVSLDKTDFGDFTPEAHVDTDTTPF
jgi:hypothetical protein